MNTFFISELLKLIENERQVESKIELLKENSSKPLLEVLRNCYDKTIKFYTKKIPTYTPDEAPMGVNPSNLFQTYRQIYVLHEAHPATKERKDIILTTMLEGMHIDECKVLENVVKQKPLVKGLTESVIRKAFPDLLPPKQQ